MPTNGEESIGVKNENMYIKEEKMLNVQPIFENIKNSFTYECWVKPEESIQLVQESPDGITGTNGQRYIIGPGQATDERRAGVGLSVGVNGVAIFEHTANHLPALLVFPTRMTGWTHIAVVYNNKIPYLYINGKLKKKGICSQKEDVYASGLFFGYTPYGFYKGHVKSIKIWDHPRSIKEIRKSMNSEIRGDEQGLFYQWEFDRNTSGSSNNTPASLPTQPHLSNLKVLFVLSGCQSRSMPYIPLEESILASLQAVVKEVYSVSPYQDVLQIALKEKPDLILVFHGFEFPIPKIQALKNSGFKTAIWLVDDPYYTDLTKEFVPYYDFIFTLEINCVPFYKSLGCQNVYHLLLAADTSVFYPKEVSLDYHTDILFIGSAFWNRVSFFNNITNYLVDKKVLISGLWWDRLKGYNVLKDKIRLNHWMSPEETASFYSGAKIVINMHRTHEDQTYNKNTQNIPAISLNPRTFEVSACGAFQLIDYRPGLTSCYIPGYDIETYTGPQDLIKKIDYYLHHEDKRKQIADRALNKVRTQHTYLNRIIALLNIVFSNN